MKKEKNKFIKICVVAGIICIGGMQSRICIKAEETKKEQKEKIERTIFLQPEKNKIDVSNYQWKKKDAKGIVEEVLKDNYADSLVKVSYQEDEKKNIRTISIHRDEALEASAYALDEISEEAEEEPAQDIQQKVMKDYAQLQSYYEDHPDYFGVPVPFFSDKNTEETPLGAIMELTETNSENPDLQLLDQSILGITQGLKAYVSYYGNELYKIRDEAMKLLDDEMSATEKYLVLHDFIAEQSLFDYTYFNNKEESFISSTLFGPLTAKKGICLGYAGAYAYLVQNAFPEIYKNNDGTWKTKEEVGDAHIIDFAKTAGPHYLNVLKDNGKWYYADICFDDTSIQERQYVRAETDGTCKHLCFMFSQNTLEKWAGNIDSAYKKLCTDTSYEKEWFANVNTTVSYNKDYWFYTEGQNSARNNAAGLYIDRKDQLKARNRKTGEIITLLDYETGKASKLNGEDAGTLTKIAQEYKKDVTYYKIYPGMQHSVGIYEDSLYFNLGNKIYRYRLSDGNVSLLKEYNTVYVGRDPDAKMDRQAFYVSKPDDKNYNMTLTEHPVGGLCIKDDGKLYVSIATNLSDATKPTYSREVVGYIPYYGFWGENNYYKKTFQYCVNVKETLSMEHLTGQEHRYTKMRVNPTCMREGFEDIRCSDCGISLEDGRSHQTDALEHHYVYSSNEKKYVCTICNDAKEKASEHNYVKKEYCWSQDCQTCTIRLVCSYCKKEMEESLNVTKEVMKNSTCKEKGIVCYTASGTCQGKTYTDEKVAYLPLLPVKVSLEKSSISMYATQKSKLKIKSNYEGDQIVSMKSRAPEIAAVSGKDGIYAVKSGRTTITAETASGQKLYATVTVKTPAVSLTASSMPLQMKKSTTALKVSRKLATDQIKTWKSSNEKIAKVGRSGKIRAGRKGTAYVTVWMKSGAKARCKVKVQKTAVKLRKISLEKYSVRLKLKNGSKSYQIRLKRNPITAGGTISYKSSDKRTAYVSKRGKITAKRAGSCTVTVWRGKVKKKLKVRVSR